MGESIFGWWYNKYRQIWILDLVHQKQADAVFNRKLANEYLFIFLYNFRCCRLKSRDNYFISKLTEKNLKKKIKKEIFFFFKKNQNWK